MGERGKQHHTVAWRCPYCLPPVRVHVVDPSSYTPPYDHALCDALSLGAALLDEARKIIAVHDEALRRLGAAEQAPPAAFVIGVTDHAADRLLPPIVEELAREAPGLEVRFRFGRTAPLNEAVDRGDVDLAVFIAEASARKGAPVGALPLVWCAAQGFAPPRDGQAWPLIAIEAPCAIRRRAMDVLSEHGIRTRVVAEAAYLAGVMNAARAGLGVALLATAGAPPEGLVELTCLPVAAPISLTARTRAGADERTAQAALHVLQATLAGAAALTDRRSRSV